MIVQIIEALDTAKVCEPNIEINHPLEETPSLRRTSINKLKHRWYLKNGTMEIKSEMTNNLKRLSVDNAENQGLSSGRDLALAKS